MMTQSSKKTLGGKIQDKILCRLTMIRNRKAAVRKKMREGDLSCRRSCWPGMLSIILLAGDPSIVNVLLYANNEKKRFMFY